jgi:RNA polymerase sigma-70 factor (ECF subfamily)
VALDVDFETVFRAQFPRLVALGLAMTGDREVATDLAQETMARAHARWEEVSQMGSPEGWVRQVMTNLLIDHHRRRVVERGALERLAARPGSREPWSATGGDVDLGDLLATLPPRQRAVVALYYLEDLPVAAIAETLGIANGTVKALLWKARASLANRLGLER